jgi:Ser/Thr protein kinase RdoA (MazF antagonist)
MATRGIGSASGEDAPLDINPRAVLRAGWGLDVPEPEWNTAGVKGKALARVRASGMDLCLRRYPADTDPTWLAGLHRVQQELAQKGFQLLPALRRTPGDQTVLSFEGRLYELTDWAPGQHQVNGTHSLVQLEHLGAAIARLHKAGAGLEPPPADLGPDGSGISDPSWWIADTQRIGSLVEFFRSTFLADEFLRSRMGAEVGAALEVLDGTADFGLVDQTITHGDLWSEHVLYEGEEVSAVLDVDGLNRRPAWDDVAALLADFADFDPTRSRACLAGYRSVRPLDETALAVIPRAWLARTLAVLRQRIDWHQNGLHRLDALAGPTPRWIRQLVLLVGLEHSDFVSEL